MRRDRFIARTILGLLLAGGLVTGLFFRIKLNGSIWFISAHPRVTVFIATVLVMGLLIMALSTLLVVAFGE